MRKGFSLPQALTTEEHLQRRLPLSSVYCHCAAEERRPLIQAVTSYQQTAEVKAVKELIEIMAKALAEYPEQVRVREIAGQQMSVIELQTAKEDLGKIIGKQGRNAQAMRTILKAASTKLRRRVVLEIVE